MYFIIDQFAAISGLTLTELSRRNDKIYDKKLKDREREWTQRRKEQIKIVCPGILYAVDGFGIQIDSTTVAAQINRASKQPT